MKKRSIELSQLGGIRTDQATWYDTIQGAGGHKEYSLRAQRRVQLVGRLIATENTMGFSLLLSSTPVLSPLRTSDLRLPIQAPTSDLLINQELTRSKEVTLSGGDGQVDLIGSSLVVLRMLVFDKVS